MVRAHVAALGGNAVVSYSMKECVLMENPNKNQVLAQYKHTFYLPVTVHLQITVSYLLDPWQLLVSFGFNHVKFFLL